ncbi:MAG: ZIP family metal transporter [Cytophagales bacterium]|nr:ZIP family metal transporter [Bernardetiaceae bacterium]MDW8211713.1 ZIP family metal transporter [Cytophagales bacterium]
MFNELVFYFSQLSPVKAAFLATVFTWLVTAAGAAIVFFFPRLNRVVLDGMLGFTGGVMIAASFWSLLAPAIAMSNGSSKLMKVLPAALGFLAGALFLFLLDKVLPHLHINFRETEGMKSSLHSTILLVLAITLHNIPEGLAIGVLFGGVSAEVPQASISSALTLSIAIGLQNFPEGIAIAMPLRRMGMSRTRSFLYGQLSAIVEPIASVAGATAVSFFTPLLPYALAFAAGAMIFVVVEEVIPETQLDQNTDIATLGFIAGFIIMMVLDVALN